MIKVPYENCLRFIENYLNIELFDFQRTLLKALCNGEDIRGGRGFGRSTVVKGYTEYLSRLLDKNYTDGYSAKVHLVDEEPLVEFKNGSWINIKE